jgi:uncharacterized protein
MSKLILILLVLLVGIWLWRANRPASPKQPPKAAPQPLEMVRCSHCAVHLPQADAVQGKKGVYCSTDHLARAEP